MSKYKIVASDLDGTLLNNQADISEENLAAIDALIKKGVWFVPASGRTLSEIPKKLTSNPAIRYFLLSNGASVTDRVTGERVLSCLSNDKVRKILDVVNSYESHVTYRHNGECIVDAKFQTEKDWDYYNVIEAHREVVREFAIYSQNFKEDSYGADQVEVISVFFKNYDDKVECKRKLEEDKDLRVVAVSECNIEVVNTAAGKGNALRALAEMTGADVSEIICLGDSDNDHSMICEAGLGLAMSNACDTLKETADEIICSNEDHAIKYVLEHYFND